MGGLAAREVGEHLSVHCVALVELVVPGAGGVEWWVGQDVVDYLVAEGLEAWPVLGKSEVFGEAGEGCGGFEDHEVVNVFVEFVQADLEPVELCVDHDQIVDLSPNVSTWERFPLMYRAVACGIYGIEEAVAIEAAREQAVLEFEV